MNKFFSSFLAFAFLVSLSFVPNVAKAQTPPLGDLIVEDVSATNQFLYAASAGRVELKVKIKNIGTQDVDLSSPWPHDLNIHVYVDEKLKSFNIDNYREGVRFLRPGESREFKGSVSTVTAVFPGEQINLPSGTSLIRFGSNNNFKVVVDPFNYISESKEDNNSLNKAFTIDNSDAPKLEIIKSYGNLKENGTYLYNHSFALNKPILTRPAYLKVEIECPVGVSAKLPRENTERCNKNPISITNANKRDWNSYAQEYYTMEVNYINPNEQTLVTVSVKAYDSSNKVLYTDSRKVLLVKTVRKNDLALIDFSWTPFNPIATKSDLQFTAVVYNNTYLAGREVVIPVGTQITVKTKNGDLVASTKVSKAIVVPGRDGRLPLDYTPKKNIVFDAIPNNKVLQKTGIYELEMHFDSTNIIDEEDEVNNIYSKKLIEVFSPSGTNSSIPCPPYFFTRTNHLFIGDTGPDVVALQEFLVAKKLLVMPAGARMGTFGNLSNTALSQYKKDKGVPQLPFSFLKDFINADLFDMCKSSILLPDLIVEDFTWKPLAPNLDNTNLSVEVALKNVGKEAVISPSSTYILTSDGLELSRGSFIIESLPAGGVKKLNLSFYQKDKFLTAGTKNIQLNVDQFNLIKESNETNNTLTKQITISPTGTVVTPPTPTPVPVVVPPATTPTPTPITVPTPVTPTISSISPSEASFGSRITLSVKGFSESESVKVLIGNKYSVNTTVSGNSVVFTLPKIGACSLFQTSSASSACSVMSAGSNQISLEKSNGTRTNQVSVSVVDGSAPAVTCSPSQSTVGLNQPVTFTANVTNGGLLTKYTWTGTDDLSGSAKTVTKSYSTAGTKQATINVITNSKSISSQCSVNVSSSASSGASREEQLANIESILKSLQESILNLSK